MAEGGHDARGEVMGFGHGEFHCCFSDEAEMPQGTTLCPRSPAIGAPLLTLSRRGRVGTYRAKHDAGRGGVKLWIRSGRTNPPTPLASRATLPLQGMVRMTRLSPSFP